MSLHLEAVSLIKDRGYERRSEPFKLASGQLSHDYIDGKFAVDNGERLALISRALGQLAAERGLEFNTVGGLTMGADAIAHGVAVVSGSYWFSVRKEPKPRGREQWIEGARLGQDNRVLLVDDVVSMGGSIIKAYDRVLETGATVVGVIPMWTEASRAGDFSRHWMCRTFPSLRTWTWESIPLDRNSLLRLAEVGLEPFLPTDLTSLAEWCWDYGEATGDARYCSLWMALKHIEERFERYEAVPAEVVYAANAALRRWNPLVLEHDEAKDACASAQALRAELLSLDPARW